MDNYLVKCLADAAASLEAATEHASEIHEHEMSRRCGAARRAVEAILKAEVNGEKLIKPEDDSRE